GLALHQWTCSPVGLGWSAALALAGYAVLASVIFVRVPTLRVGTHARTLCVPSDEQTSRDAERRTLAFPRGAWERGWFLPAQACVASVVVALSLWMCLQFAALVDRLGGPAAVLLLVPATVVLIRRDAVVPFTDWLRPLALSLGAIAAAEIGWACPDPVGPAPWFHRNVLLMVALAAMTALYGVPP